MAAAPRYEYRRPVAVDQTPRVIDVQPERPGRENAGVRVTYDVEPRGERFSSPDMTGDVVLFASPRGTLVRYSWDGGTERLRGTLRLKGFLPQTVRIEAEAPETGVRTSAWIPVRANSITTVRFAFPSGREDRR